MSELDTYDYSLPRPLVAQSPISDRVDARLLVVRRQDQGLSHRRVRDLPELLRPGDCMVINDTRVLAARLIGLRTATGGAWEGLFLGTDEHGNWRMLTKTRGRLKPGEKVTLLDLRARENGQLVMLTCGDEGVWLARPEADEEPLELLERLGRVPLPPYIRGGEMLESDRESYQTVFARRPGSAAAPTAGLHFTNELLGQLVDRGVSIVRVTLHIGLDTFRPIKSETLDEHRMHCEEGQIDESAVAVICRQQRAGGRVVAVGSTSVRVLETAAAKGELAPWSGKTDLFIRPPYRFRAADALLTNFHLPRSTLLVLVRTFGGEALMKQAYETAIRHRYRFYSYGDAMLIL